MSQRLVTAVTALLVASPAVAGELFRDDFSRFPPGVLSAPVGQLNGAIQEYHYLPHRGVPLGPWTNPIVHLDSWAGGDADGKPYLEQHQMNGAPELMTPLLVTGDPEWRSTTVEVKVQALSLRDRVGLVFRYRTSRQHYFFGFERGKRAVLLLRQPIEKEFRVLDVRELGAVPFSYDPRRVYTLRVENDGPRIRAFIDGKRVIEASDATILAGRAGVAADKPARFQDFVVSTPDAVERQIRADIARRQDALRALEGTYPGMRLLRRFKTPGFGAGRNVRFGDLDGDGRLDMLFGQNVAKVRGDAFDHISALTAVDLDGRVLWQVGRPDPRNTLVTNDTPFQIHDINGDGKNEVVVAKDFKLQVLEGTNGEVEQWAWMPEAPAANVERPYEINNGDSIAFFRLSDKPGRREVLIKDRYKSFWLLDDELRVLWKGEGQTGHYPFPMDFDGDGRDEIVIGFSLWSPQGKRLWGHDANLKDHTDAISAGNYSGDSKGEPRIYACGSDEGFLVFGKDGKILKHVRIGHAQTQSVGDYLPGRKGLEIMVVNFWKSPGIVTLFDHEGSILRQAEIVSGSSHMQPVNWRGDGGELAVTSASVREGGLVDGELRRVVRFPDDGHPDLAYQVADVAGDVRDEIIVWNTEEVWIYTQDRPFTGRRIYSPRRNPFYNDSNYRAIVSLPAWKDVVR